MVSSFFFTLLKKVIAKPIFCSQFPQMTYSESYLPSFQKTP